MVKHEMAQTTRRLFVLICCLCATPLPAATVLLTQQFSRGSLKLYVDDSRVSPVAISRYLVVHPVAYDTDYYLGAELALCGDGDSRYLPCGTRDYRAPNWLDNAERNIKFSRAKLNELTLLKDFPELQPLVDYFARSLRFSIWKNECLLEYYRNWDAASLERNYEALPVIESTKHTLADLRATEDPAVRWELSYYEWGNIVNSLYRRNEGAVPSSVWDSFEKAHGIREQIAYIGGDE